MLCCHIRISNYFYPPDSSSHLSLWAACLVFLRNRLVSWQEMCFILKTSSLAVLIVYLQITSGLLSLLFLVFLKICPLYMQQSHLLYLHYLLWNVFTPSIHPFKNVSCLHFCDYFLSCASEEIPSWFVLLMPLPAESYLKIPACKQTDEIVRVFVNTQIIAAKFLSHGPETESCFVYLPGRCS